MMKKILLAGAMAASVVVASPAFAAFNTTQALTFINTGPLTYSSNFGNGGTATAGFSDTYTFKLSDLLGSNTGTATSTVTTITLLGTNSVVITGVTLDSGGILSVYTPQAAVTLIDGSVRYSFDLPATALQGSGANPDQIVTVLGSAPTGGSYAGTFNLTAVPEPATWAMMLAGFGAVGYSLRRRKSYRLLQAV